jgi:hypothetical protein
VFGEYYLKKQSQFKAKQSLYSNVQCSVFSMQRQDEEMRQTWILELKNEKVPKKP